MSAADADSHRLVLTDAWEDSLEVSERDAALYVRAPRAVELDRASATRLRDHLCAFLGDHQDMDTPAADPTDTLRVADGCADYASDLDSYAWPVPHFHLMSDGTLKDTRTGERYTLQPADKCDGAAVPVQAKLEDLLGDTEDLPLTITREAELAVYGDRQDDYGHPREDFTRTAILWTGLLHHKLDDGSHITPEDVARCMIGVKLSRDVHAPKRDNRVDGAGYFLTLDRLETGR